MAPAVLASIIGAGASSLGGVLGFFGQNHANAQALANVREQNAWQEKMWHLSNLYNAPTAQVERLKQAGINPAIALGNITPGTAQAMSAPAPAGAGNAGAELGRGISNAGMMALQAYQQSQLNEAQVDKLRSEAELNRAQIPGENKRPDVMDSERERNLAQRDEALQNSELAKKKAWEIQQLTPVKKMEYMANAEKAVESAQFTRLQQAIAKFDLQYKKPLEVAQMKADITRIYALAGYLVAQKKLSVEQAKLVVEQTANAKLSRDGIRWDNMMKADEYGRAESEYWHRMANLDAQTALYKQEKDESTSREIGNYVSALVSVVGACMGMPIPAPPSGPTQRTLPAGSYGARPKLK